MRARGRASAAAGHASRIGAPPKSPAASCASGAGRANGWPSSAARRLASAELRVDAGFPLGVLAGRRGVGLRERALLPELDLPDLHEHRGRQQPVRRAQVQDRGRRLHEEELRELREDVHGAPAWISGRPDRAGK